MRLWLEQIVSSHITKIDKAKSQCIHTPIKAEIIMDSVNGILHEDTCLRKIQFNTLFWSASFTRHLYGLMNYSNNYGRQMIWFFVTKLDIQQSPYQNI